MTEKVQPYTVKMHGAAGLRADQQSAAELRFRMALEFGVGGPDYVVPALQACMLARSLIANLPPAEVTQAEHGAELEVIALWENAEDKAIVTALKPLNTARDLGETRFEITI
ncbi:MAG: hypothetical protein JJD98_16460 [Polaromonas sp.]|nr:hypothetical protein [Polaromonas sp.]